MCNMHRNNCNNHNRVTVTKKNSLVSKKDFLHGILALVVHFDLELQQMNVKIVFLNGDLEEKVYMK